MKKTARTILSATVSLMICVTMVFGSSIAPSSAATDIIIQDFETGTADSLTSNAGNPTTRTLDTATAAAGNSLKVTYETGPDAWNVIFVTRAVSDWSGTTFLKFWISNPNAKTTEFDLFIEDTARHTTVPSMPAYLISETDGVAVKSAFGANARLPIPSGFTGYVMVPFTSFSTPDTIDLSAITALAFCCDAVSNLGLTVYFDNFGATDVAPGEIAVNIQDFEAGTVDTLSANAGRPTTRSLDTTVSDAGNSLKVTYEAGADAWNVIFVTMKNKDWSGTDFLKFWISNPNTSDAAFDLFIEDTSRHATVATAPAYLISDDGGTVSAGEFGPNARLPIPAGFSGYVMVPYTSFGTSESLDLSAITALAFCCDAVENLGKTFYFDSFSATSVAPVLPLPFSENQLTGFEGTDDVSRFATRWADGGLISFALDQEFKSEGEQSFKMTIDGLNPDGVSPAAIVFLPVYTTDWTGKSGITLWVSNPNDSSLDFDLFYENTSGVRMQTITKNNAPVYYLPDGASLATASTFNGRFLVPAAFSGYVYIPFTSFAFALWSIDEETFDGTFDFSDMRTFALCLDITNYIGKIMYFDDIKVYAELPEVEQPPVEDSTEESSDTSSEVTSNTPTEAESAADSTDENPSTGDASGLPIYFLLGALAMIAFTTVKMARKSTD